MALLHWKCRDRAPQDYANRAQPYTYLVWSVLNQWSNNFFFPFNLYRHGDHYQWEKVTSCIHNLFGGQRWVDQYGELIITNQGRASCKLQFIKVSSHVVYSTPTGVSTHTHTHTHVYRRATGAPGSMRYMAMCTTARVNE